MIARAGKRLRAVRRLLSRSEWGVRLFGMPRTPACGAEPGLILIQIDGLSRTQLERALRTGRMPFLKRLLSREDYRLHSLYSGVPSSTPAVQAELFYGKRTAVPAFQFRRGTSGELSTMMQPDTAAAVEDDLRREGEPLLDGGAAYSDIYTGGAENAGFCAAAMGLSDVLRRNRPLLLLGYLVLHAFVLMRVVALMTFEIVLALWDVLRGAMEKQDLFYEITFIPKRLAVVILLRELVVAGVRMDAARGVPVIHCNFFGYDEQAHRRGPSSAFAHWTLKGIDGAIRRIWAEARRSTCRDYDIWVYSDHGQEDSLPYAAFTGRTVQEAVADIVGRRVDDPGLRGETGGTARDRHQLLGGRVLQKLLRRPRRRGMDQPVEVAGMGPVGHVYLNASQSRDRRAEFARRMVREACIPAVLFRREGDTAIAVTENAEGPLERLRTQVLGEDHPFLEEAAADLENLLRHPESGDLVLLGWRPRAKPLTFPVENGAHAGPGREETHAFALLPDDAPVAAECGRLYLRPLHLHEAALRHLGRLKDKAPLLQAASAARSEGDIRPLRVMTYNIHGGCGMDGVVSLSRIARVIARFDPDIVALQEVDVGRTRSGGVDQAHEIARLLDMEHHFHPSFVVEDEKYGNAILSRHPLRLVQAGELPRNGSREPRGVLWVEADVDGIAVQVLNTHLGLERRERLEQLRELQGVGWLSSPECRSPAIVCADLNAAPDSPEHRQLTRRFLDATAGGNGMLRSWMGVRQLDYIFASLRIRPVRSLMPMSHLSRCASDHFPVVVDLDLGKDTGLSYRRANHGS